MAVCSAFHSCFEFKVKFREMRFASLPAGTQHRGESSWPVPFLCLERQLREPTQEHWCHEHG